MTSRDSYYYLHINGDLIYKPAYVVDSDPDYFRSDFVRKVWKVYFNDRVSAYLMLLEAAAMGARKDRIDHLVQHWGVTDKDCCTFVKNVPGLHLCKVDSIWCATYADFDDSTKGAGSGYGPRAIDALMNLKRK